MVFILNLATAAVCGIRQIIVWLNESISSGLLHSCSRVVFVNVVSFMIVVPYNHDDSWQVLWLCRSE